MKISISDGAFINKALLGLALSLLLAVLAPCAQAGHWVATLKGSGQIVGNDHSLAWPATGTGSSYEVSDFQSHIIPFQETHTSLTSSGQVHIDYTWTPDSPTDTVPPERTVNALVSARFHILVDQGKNKTGTLSGNGLGDPVRHLTYLTDPEWSVFYLNAPDLLSSGGRIIAIDNSARLPVVSLDLDKVSATGNADSGYDFQASGTAAFGGVLPSRRTSSCRLTLCGPIILSARASSTRCRRQAQQAPSTRAARTGSAARPARRPGWRICTYA